MWLLKEVRAHVRLGDREEGSLCVLLCVCVCVCVDRGEGAFRQRLGGKKEPGILVPGIEISSRDRPGGCEGRMVRKDPEEQKQGLVNQRQVCHPRTVESTEGIS